MLANCHLENWKKIPICQNRLHRFQHNFSLSAIKSTVIDYKTANINNKNCSLSTVLTATHHKLQVIKRWYYSASRWLICDMMVGNIPFLIFCSFWCIAVNTVDKRQFLSFISYRHTSIVSTVLKIPCKYFACIFYLLFRVAGEHAVSA